MLRMAWVLTLDNTLTWPDGSEFTEIARALARGDGYVSPSFRANPVLPVYLSLVFRLCGEHYLAPRIGQSIIGALTAVLVYRTAALLIGPTVGILSGIVLAVY